MSDTTCPVFRGNDVMGHADCSISKANQVNVLHPKADRLLKDLADMNLIAIKQTGSDGFMQVIERLRSKAERLGPPTMEEITKEVETVRAERYARRKSSDFYRHKPLDKLLLTRDFSKFDQLMSANRTTLLISQELLEEIVEVAERPKFRKYFDLSDLTDLLVNLKQKAELVQVRTQVDICRDNKDNFLLSLAVDGNAPLLLTEPLTNGLNSAVYSTQVQIVPLAIADYTAGNIFWNYL